MDICACLCARAYPVASAERQLQPPHARAHARVNNARRGYVSAECETFCIARGNRCIYSYRDFLDSCCFQIAFRQRQTLPRERERGKTSAAGGDEQKPMREKEFIPRERGAIAPTCPRADDKLSFWHREIAVTVLSIKSPTRARAPAPASFRDSRNSVTFVGNRQRSRALTRYLQHR